MSNYTVSYAPHINDPVTTNRIMLDVVIALCPAFLCANIVFGFRASLVVGVCVATCVLCEGLYEKAMGRPLTIRDLSAVVTGMILAYNLPVTIPLWQAVFGSAVAILMVKQLFGGLGKNFANPAVTGRIVMFLAFSSSMTTWIKPYNAISDMFTGAIAGMPTDAITGATVDVVADAITGATPLALIAKGQLDAMPSLWNLFLGIRGGCLGETSVLALLIGGAYLLIRRVISWHAPVSFIATVFALTALLGAHPVYQILSGGLFLGAFFMATDYVTTPITDEGRAIFGVGAGALTVIIRLYGSYPEGVSFALLIMNTLVPYINKLTFHKALGGQTREK